MAADITGVTDRNHPGSCYGPGHEACQMSDRQLLEAIYARVLEVERMYLAWQVGGLRGLRAARRD